MAKKWEDVQELMRPVFYIILSSSVFPTQDSSPGMQKRIATYTWKCVTAAYFCQWANSFEGVCEYFDNPFSCTQLLLWVHAFPARNDE